jgi:hypothetical protein
MQGAPFYCKVGGKNGSYCKVTPASSQALKINIGLMGAPCNKRIGQDNCHAGTYFSFCEDFCFKERIKEFFVTIPQVFTKAKKYLCTRIWTWTSVLL